MLRIENVFIGKILNKCIQDKIKLINRTTFIRDFQFGWIGSPDFANSIISSDVTLPSLIIYNSSTRHHHFPEEKPHELSPESITLFLEAVRNQSVKVITTYVMQFNYDIINIIYMNLTYCSNY